jgi:hypothetical protein
MLSLHLIKLLETRHAQIPVIWHFCESGPGSSVTNGGIVLRSLILQLLKLDGDLFQYIPEPTVSYSELFSDGYFQTQWVIFENMARHQSHTRINCILDGLNECESNSLEILLEKLRTLFPDPQASDSSSSEESELGTAKPAKPASKLSIICTSRRQHPQCLQRHLKIYANVDLDDSSNKIDIEGDVRTFVRRAHSQGVQVRSMASPHAGESYRGSCYSFRRCLSIGILRNRGVEALSGCRNRSDIGRVPDRTSSHIPENVRTDSSEPPQRGSNANEVGALCSSPSVVVRAQRCYWCAASGGSVN